VLGYAVGGGANPNHNRAATDNVRQVIERTLALAGGRLPDIACLVAGLAGLDRPEHLARAAELTAVPGLDAPRIHLNDAEIAWAGALSLEPGVIVVCGTGSIIWSRTESGRIVRNYDFNQYARSAARHLAYDTVFGLLTGEAELEEPLLGAACAHFGVRSLAALRAFASENTDNPSPELKRRYSTFAPAVTHAAEVGSVLARAVCGRAAESVVTGVRLVGACFETAPVRVALIGSVARSPFMSAEITRQLAASRARYALVAPRLSPAAGAVLLGLRHLCAGAPAEERLASQPIATCAESAALFEAK